MVYEREGKSFGLVGIIEQRVYLERKGMRNSKKKMFKLPNFGPKVEPEVTPDGSNSA